MGLTRSTRNSSSLEVVQAIKAYKNFSIVSPIVMFSNFTTNLAILEAVDGLMFIHVIDFDIGFGDQLAQELEIGFEIEFVLIQTFEFLSFKAIKFVRIDWLYKVNK
ncbi:hypothetical protein ACSBR1_021259 [Camellia fascicularis]